MIKPENVTSEVVVPVPDASSDSFDLGAALERLAGRKSLVVYMHDNPDPDSLASALGLARLLEHEIGCKSTLALGGIVGRAENRAMVEVLQIPLVPQHKIHPAAHDCIAIVDSQPGTGNNSLPSGKRVDIVVDHHPCRSNVQAPWCDIRESYGATTTIILQYLRERAIPIDTQLATALFYALRTETRDLGREATEAERAAYLHLVSLADHDRLYRICHPKVPREHFAALDRALRSARAYGDIVAANLGELSYPDLVAEIADLLISLDEARFALCTGRYKGKVHVSLRTDLQYRRAGSLMREIVNSDGAAGGHGTMAGGSLHKAITDCDDMEAAFQMLVERLGKALGRDTGNPRDLVAENSAPTGQADRAADQTREIPAVQKGANGHDGHR